MPADQTPQQVLSEFDASIAHVMRGLSIVNLGDVLSGCSPEVEADKLAKFKEWTRPALPNDPDKFLPIHPITGEDVPELRYRKDNMP